jgi:acyl dehydratase
MASPKLEADTLPRLTKSVTQTSINQFESCGILERENIHNNLELAQSRLGTTYAIASGRMSVAFASESLRKYFGAEVFNHTGVVNLKFLRPVKDGDTITITGSIIQREPVESGTRVTAEVQCHNQNGDATAVGQGTAIVP